MRRLKNEELVDGLFVQVLKPVQDLNSNKPDLSDTIYEIVIENNIKYYKAYGGELSLIISIPNIDIWCETPQTLKLNRELNRDTKLDSLLNGDK